MIPIIVAIWAGIEVAVWLRWRDNKRRMEEHKREFRRLVVRHMDIDLGNLAAPAEPNGTGREVAP